MWFSNMVNGVMARYAKSFPRRPRTATVPGDETEETEPSATAVAATEAREGVWPRRLRAVRLLAVACVLGGVAFAFLDGQPPLAAVLGGGTFGGLAFLLATAALLVYWSVRETLTG